MTGIDYPTVTVGGKTLTVRFSFLAQYLLSLKGVNLSKPLEVTNPAYLATRLEIFTAAVTDNYPEGQAPTAREWASRIELTDWAPIEVALNQAVGKASEELRKGLAVVPPATAAS
jgi:hypothetical protein